MIAKLFLIICVLCTNKVLVSCLRYGGYEDSLSSDSHKPKVKIVSKNSSRPVVEKVGGHLKLSCDVVGGRFPVDFTWRKVGESDPIRSGVFNSGRSSSLEIHNLSLAVEGNYSCEASNAYGTHQAFFFLAIERPPKWLSKPGDIQVGPRDTFNIQCSGDGQPPPNITWKRQIGSEWRDLFQSTNVFTKKSKTEITGQQLIKERDEGKYGCEVSNGVNSSLWSEFMIKVGDRIWFFGEMTGAIQLTLIAPNSTNHSLTTN
ncbi:cell adhesion molecule Dscam1-like [Brevipalpus obovatus]|uniref:cell adhesion molecule Dscam1-like n=1 Tax=Brevipalpus obovatus TaxID=246614 RepID=UPI003D9EE6A7